MRNEWTNEANTPLNLRTIASLLFDRSAVSGEHDITEKKGDTRRPPSLPPKYLIPVFVVHPAAAAYKDFLIFPTNGCTIKWLNYTSYTISQISSLICRFSERVSLFLNFVLTPVIHGSMIVKLSLRYDRVMR